MPALPLKTYFLLFTFLIIVSTAFAKGMPEDEASIEAEHYLELIDHYGRPVILEKPAETIVSLNPGLTETIFALGHGERLLGRTSFCDYPPEAMDVPVAGTLIDPDLEMILAANPDIVVASTHFPKEALERLVNVGIKVALLMGPNTFDGVYDGVIRPMSRILGDIDAGEELVASMDEDVKKVLSSVDERTERPTVYYAVGFGEGGEWTAGGNTFIGEMIRMAGGINIAEDLEGWSYSLEALVAGDPDVIIVPSWAGEVFPSTKPYSELRASREGRVTAINEDAVVRQGPRMAEGFVSLAQAIGGSD